jgi:hypothetical protein
MSELTPISALVARVTCPNCATQLSCHDPANSRYFGCSKCHTFFWANALSSARAAQRIDGFKKALEPGPSLPLGSAGIIGGYRCRVTGYQVRVEKNDKAAVWREYQLRPAEPLLTEEEPADFPLQLAEYHGHWLLIRRAPNHPVGTGKKGYKETTWQDDVDDRLYKLWHRYQLSVAYAEGEFDWNILDDEKLFVTEFTSPPYLLVSEHLTSGPPSWYQAKHLEPEAVAAAFAVPADELPSRLDVGAAQPNPVADGALLRLLLIFLLLLLGLRTLVGVLRPSITSTQELVLPATLTAPLATPTAVPNDALPPIVPFDSLPATTTSTAPPAASPTAPPAAEAVVSNSSMLVSDPITLTEPTALQIELTIPDLTNRWVEITTSLVNEQTGRGYEFTRSLEYYEGVEGGERWAEGSRSVSAILSRVPAGRYHLNLYPSAEPTASSAVLQVAIEQNPVLSSNSWLAVLLLMAVPLLQWWRYTAFENSRWENSNFAPKS